MEKKIAIFSKKGCNDFDKIPLVYGDHCPK
jgi:hypothetical protein